MDLVANPVTLGGLVAFLALGAWAMGRLQGAAEAPGPACDPPGVQRHDDPAHAVPESSGSQALAAALQPEARSPLLTPLALADSLGQLHAEISAFRRQERVLASLEAELLPLRPGSGDHADAPDPAGFASSAPPNRTQSAINPRPALRS